MLKIISKHGGAVVLLHTQTHFVTIHSSTEGHYTLDFSFHTIVSLPFTPLFLNI